MQITPNSVSSAKTPPRISKPYLSNYVTYISKGMSNKYLKLNTAKTEHFISSSKLASLPTLPFPGYGPVVQVKKKP